MILKSLCSHDEKLTSGATYVVLSGHFVSSPEPKAQGELIVHQSSRRLCVWLCVCLAVCLQTFSNLNISATSGPIITKFYLNHHWGGGKAALGFGPDRIGTRLCVWLCDCV